MLCSARSCRSSICSGSPLSSFHVIWSPCGDTIGASVVFEAVHVPCPGPLHFFNSADYVYDLFPLPGRDNVGPYFLVCYVE